MALTRVTSTVLDANAVSAEKLANSSIVTRHLGDAVVTLRNLAADANTQAIVAGVVANTNLLQTNLNSVTGNVNLVQSNVVATQSNVILVLSNLTNYALFANTFFDTRANASTGYFDLLSNDFITYTRLYANINSVQDNVNTNYDQAQGNDFVTYTRLYANVNTVQDNVAAITDGSTAFTGQVTLNNDLIIQGNLTVLGESVTSNSINQVINDRIVMLANNVTGAPVADVGFLFNRGTQGNVAIYYDEGLTSFALADTRDPSTNVSIHPITFSNLKLGILEATTINSTTITYSGTDLNTAITDNRSGAISTVYATNLDTSRAVVSDASGKIAISLVTSTEVGYLDGVTSAIQTQIDTKIATTDSASNDYVTYTRITANVNAVQGNLTSFATSVTSNVNLVQDNVTALTSGAVLLIPFTNTNVSTSSSNVYFVGKNVANYANILSVTVDGIYQAPEIHWVGNFSNNTVQFTDETLPAGLIVTISSLT
jgi:hypothetical protein